ncbi:MAG: hypothetical protein HYZ49_01320 [Chloroflexi bacterium]|nr:hypothetical protein [Chloroflexota bacterium]
MTLTHTTFFDRPAYQLSNKRLSLTVVPALSGRAMELIVRKQNLFWINEPLLKGEAGGDPAMGNWMNWGGYKTWLAPQSRWPDPNALSDEMDNVEWAVVGQTDSPVATSLHLRGPIIPWSGLQLSRQITLRAGEKKVAVRESIHNASDTTQTWAAWAVAQFPTPGWAVYPSEGARKTLALTPPKFRRDQLHFKGDKKWKTGALTSEGWGEYQAKNWAKSFRASFAPHANLPHPDNCNLETWSNTDPAYMELEWLGPLVTLKPGESWAFETEWFIDLAPRQT